MPRDLDTASFVATVTVDLIPQNRYGDKLTETSTFTYTRVLLVKNLTDLAAILDNIK